MNVFSGLSVFERILLDPKQHRRRPQVWSVNGLSCLLWCGPKLTAHPGSGFVGRYIAGASYDYLEDIRTNSIN